MKAIARCPCCGGSPSRQWPALTAPFIAEYVLGAPVAICSLMECGACGLRFFDGRFESEEMARLYAGYRGEAYFAARHRHEFWYSSRHNDRTGHGRDILAARKEATAALLRRHTEIGTIRRVLDYGGDSGQFIPDAIGEVKDVFEVSDAPPIPGVSRISDELALESGSYDLILLNHVLEHAPDPLDLLHRVSALLKEGEGVLHVEVPLERYSLRWARGGMREVNRLSWLARRPVLMRWLDFYSTLFRVALDMLPPFGFIKLHEHINLFDERSLARACQSAGLEVLVVDTRNSGRDTVIAALARRPSSKGS